MCYGREGWWLRGVLVGAVSCPDWVRWELFSDDDNVYDSALAVGPLGLPSAYVQTLYDRGRVGVVVDCANAPSVLVLERLGWLLRQAGSSCSGDTSSNRYGDFYRAPIVDMLSHQNMQPAVRHECTPWFPEVLWLVARGRFLGRAA